MPEWLKFLLADTSALQLVFWFVAIGALIAVIVKLWPALSQFVSIMNAVTGLPKFIERTDDSIHKLRRQIENDHDSNLRDELTEALDTTKRLEDTAQRLEEGVAGLYVKVGELAASDEELREADERLRVDLENTQPSRWKEPE